MTFSNRPAPLPFFKTDFPLFLAPMAGVTDPIFRTICKELGVDVMVTEFVSAEGILQAWERNRRYTKIENAHRPIGIQLFGADGNHMGEAARIILDHEKPDFESVCPCITSVTEIKNYLTSELQQIDENSELNFYVRAMRNACNKFLSKCPDRKDFRCYACQSGNIDNWIFTSAVGELRGVFGIMIGQIALFS